MSLFTDCRDFDINVADDDRRRTLFAMDAGWTPDFEGEMRAMSMLMGDEDNMTDEQRHTLFLIRQGDCG